MKSTGIVRRIDELGRVVLPVDLRRALGLEVRDPVEVFVEEDCVILRKYQPSCIFCGGSKSVTHFRNKPVCAECRRQLKSE
ncbi:MAG: AbrB/MazE/SpoVT family DNA-binding domain-containing protein [Ruminococcaceae bacterium]|nr:AbrB/MazE/SpoVT family DNA-binding domain-containing protein [Oscillospiraceae bacterium]